MVTEDNNRGRYGGTRGHILKLSCKDIAEPFKNCTAIVRMSSSLALPNSVAYLCTYMRFFRRDCCRRG